MRTKPKDNPEWGERWWSRERGMPDSMPKEIQSMPDIGRNASWSEAIEALLGAGFVAHAASKSYERQWEAEDDPMGAFRDPETPGKFRFHVLMTHPEGFVVMLDSYQRRISSDPKDWSRGPFDVSDRGSEASQSLNSLNIYYQIEFGANFKGLGMVMSSGQCHCSAEGWSLTGHDNAVTGRRSLKALMLDIYRNGRPLKISDWDPCFIYLDHQLYSQAPNSSWAAKSEQIKAKFGKRLEKDLEAFMQAIPPELASVAGERKSKPSMRFTSDAYDYALKTLARAGRQWPDKSEQEALRGWMEHIEEAMENAQSSKPARIANLPGMDRKCAGGGGPLHAVACLEAPPQALAPVEEWMAKLPREQWEALMASRDDSGLTPSGVAFERALASRTWSYGGEDRGMGHSFRALGACCAPGEIGTLLMEAFATSKKVGKAGLDALEIEAAIQACEMQGVDWLAPMVPAGEEPLDGPQAAEMLHEAGLSCGLLADGVSARLEARLLGSVAGVSKAGSKRRI